jgi:hypothetical protein
LLVTISTASIGGAGWKACCRGASSFCGSLGGCDFPALPLALGRAGTLKSCSDNKAARLDGAVGKGMKNSCALGWLRVQKRNSRHVTRAAVTGCMKIWGMCLIMHGPL